MRRTIQTLDVVIREATGQDTRTYAAEKLYEPVGMDHTDFGNLFDDDDGELSELMGEPVMLKTMRRLSFTGVVFPKRTPARRREALMRSAEETKTQTGPRPLRPQHHSETLYCVGK